MVEVLLFVIIAMLGLVIFMFFFKKPPKEDEASSMLKQDIDKLDERLDKNQKMMIDSIQKQFSQSSAIIADVTKNLTEIKESNKQVVSVTDELKTLQNILQNPKQRGVIGEYYLQTVLDNMLPPSRFEMQYNFKDGDIVDAVIFLDKNKMLPVDSKFSLENYNRLVESKSKTNREKLVKTFKADLKARIDETAKYIRPDEDTMDFAFMFIPSEAIYYDLLINKVGEANTSSRDLIEYAFREKNVIIVSPTSFMAYLQTVLQGLRSLQIEEQAKQIQKQVGQLDRHVSVYQDIMLRLGKSLGVSVNHYNSAHNELKKIDKDISKIAGTKSSVSPISIDKPKDD